MARDIWRWTNPKTGKQTWYVNVWDPALGRKIKKAVGPSRREAEEAAARLRASIRDTGIAFTTKATKLDDFIPRFLEERYARKRCYPDARRFLTSFRQFAGNRRLSVITKGLLQRYVTKRLNDPVRSPFRGRLAQTPKAREWKPGCYKRVQEPTVNREISVIICMMNHAVKCDEIASNPLARFGKFPEKQRARKRHLHIPEMKALLAACAALKASPLADIINLALFIGRRFSEIVGIKRRDYDRENGYVYFGKTKKGEPDTIPVPPSARLILDRLFEEAEKADCEWLFPNRSKTGPVKDVRTAFERAKRAAGITGLRFHDLRHTAISFMVMSGMDFFSIAALVGHTTPTMIEERYGHLTPKHREASSFLFGGYMDRILGMTGGQPGQAAVEPEPPIARQVADLLSGLGVKSQDGGK